MFRTCSTNCNTLAVSRSNTGVLTPQLISSAVIRQSPALQRRIWLPIMGALAKTGDAASGPAEGPPRHYLDLSERLTIGIGRMLAIPDRMGRLDHA